MGALTPEEWQFVAWIWLGLCEAYPGRSFSVEARPLAPGANQGWILIAVAEPDRSVCEQVPRDAIRHAGANAVKASVLRSLLAKLDNPAAMAS